LSSANHHELNSVSDLTEILKKENAEDGILFLVHTPAGAQFVVLKPV
jgi:hypothetical protein